MSLMRDDTRVILAGYTRCFGRLHALFWQATRVILAGHTRYFGELHVLFWRATRVKAECFDQFFKYSFNFPSAVL